MSSSVDFLNVPVYVSLKRVVSDMLTVTLNLRSNVRNTSCSGVCLNANSGFVHAVSVQLEVVSNVNSPVCLL